MNFAFIFDVDGVLLRTMEAHFECYRQALEEANIPIDKAQFFSQAGMIGQEQIKYFAAKAGVKVDVEKIYARKIELFQEHSDAAQTIDCNVRLLSVLRSAKIPVGIASGSSRKSWVPLLAKFGIQADALVGAEDVQRGKPHPDLFLCVAEMLGVQPSNCIVIEDSDAGIVAAQAAGMKAMRFYDNGAEKKSSSVNGAVLCQTHR
jgi:HAD superfamily hydrolase (TIGR01509 family)